MNTIDQMARDVVFTGGAMRYGGRAERRARKQQTNSIKGFSENLSTLKALMGGELQNMGTTAVMFMRPELYKQALLAQVEGEAFEAYLLNVLDDGED